MQFRQTRYRVLLSASSILILCLSSGQADIRTDYVVEVVTFKSGTTPRSAALHKVVAYDSRSDSVRIAPRDLERDVYSIFCELADEKKPRKFLENPKEYPILNNPEIKILVRNHLPEAGVLGQYHGPCHSGSGFRSTRAIGMQIHRDRDLHRDTQVFFVLYCLYNDETDEVILVDSIIFPPDYFGRSLFSKGQFNSEGTHFYYSKDGVIKRFHIESGIIEELMEGSIPIIPWNQEAIVVYNEKEGLFKLLSDDGVVKSIVKRKIWPRKVTSVFAIDSTTFVVASSAPPKEWYPPNEEVYVIDFATGKSQLLIERISVLQILDAKRVE